MQIGPRHTHPHNCGGNGACPGPMAGSVKSSPRLNTVTPLREMGNMHSQHVVARLFANTLVPVVHTASAEPDGHRVATLIRTQLRQTSSSICCIRLFEGLFMNRHLLHPQMPTYLRDDTGYRTDPHATDKQRIRPIDPLMKLLHHFLNVAVRDDQLHKLRIMLF